MPFRKIASMQYAIIDNGHGEVPLLFGGNGSYWQIASSHGTIVSAGVAVISVDVDTEDVSVSVFDKPQKPRPGGSHYYSADRPASRKEDSQLLSNMLRERIDAT